MKRKFMYVLLMSIFILSSAYTTALAGDNNISFKFRIPGGSGKPNGQETDCRYRQTKSYDNPWKVNLKESGEGAGTRTEFWLEKSSGKNVAPVVSVKQGAGAYYREAFPSASQTNVYLTAQNNNENGKSYTVSGCWDEETW